MKIKMELSQLEARMLLRIARHAEANGFNEGELFEDHHHRLAAERAITKLQYLLGISDEPRPDPRCTCDEDSQCGLCSTGQIDGSRFHWGRA